MAKLWPDDAHYNTLYSARDALCLHPELNLSESQDIRYYTYTIG